MFERYTGYPPNTRLIFVLTMGSTLLEGDNNEGPVSKDSI